MSRRRERIAPLPQGPITTAEEYDGITRGDPVKIAGERGFYRFVQYVTHRNGNAWAALYGGQKDPNGERGWRCVDPDRVKRSKR